MARWTKFSIWCGNMHGYLTADIICSKMLTFSLKRNSRKLLGGGGGGQWGRVSRFPYHVLPPPVLLSPFASRLPPFIVLLPSSGEWRGSETRVNFQTVPKLNVLVHFLNRYEMAWHMCQVPCYLMTSDVIELKGFPNSPEVMLFFQPESCSQNFLLSIGGC